ncbi:hypothetical protein [Coxiella burnetii]|nr:hypothetical protein [Coxiella burnetii]MDE3400526.1 hypothetical protein [Coxiella burnetii]
MIRLQQLPNEEELDIPISKLTIVYPDLHSLTNARQHWHCTSSTLNENLR